jgi:hypothetical protein
MQFFVVYAENALYSLLIVVTTSSSSSVWGRRLPTECTAAYRGLLYYPALVSPSSPEALHIRRRERPLLAREGTMGEKCPIKFSLQMRLPR